MGNERSAPHEGFAERLHGSSRVDALDEIAVSARRYQGTLQGYNVRYVEADSAFAHYSLAGADEQRKLLRAFLEPDLLVLDDLFLARRIADASAELLQAVVHQRYKLRRSIVVTSNRVVQDWGKYLGDNTMRTTILDRLMHRSTLLEFEGKSYRLQEAATRIASAA